ncbi:hypothetical protein [Helicobacter pylori]|uniref:hypothetical protein n=1 Tax=Helicobacter pylori TaxID=210 RepID=UPI0013CDE2C2|nr:hypothetical protein [Helicobacter pylori]
MQPFFPKTQGFACKSGVILEFWLHAVIKRLSLAWCEILALLNKALSVFKTIINALLKQSLA